ncbi:MAG TPA: hypothetical protein VGF97_12730 [Rhizomicrobium sp.]|jgi:hypothetical protein
MAALAMGVLLIGTPAVGQQPPAASVVRPAPPRQTGLPGAVEVGALGAPDGPPAGLLDAGNGGLPPAIWQDSPRDLVEDLLGRAPLATSVPAVRGLTRVLLLTTADAPLGAAPHAFLSVRLRKLLDGGLVDEAADLAMKSAVEGDAELDRLKADALLFAGRDADVCGSATAGRLNKSDSFWIELRAYCYAASNNADAFELTRSVIHAQGQADAAFETLLDDVRNHATASPGDIAAPTALHVFLLNKAGLPVEPSLGEQLGIPASLAAMRSVNNTPSARLAAAEAVAPTGAAPVTELAAIADAQSFARAQIEAARTAADGMPFLAGQALLRQAIREKPNPAARADLVFRALELGASAGRLTLAAGLQADAAASVVPDVSLRPMAPLMATALLLAGKVDAAALWMQLFDQNENTDRTFASTFATALALAAPSAAHDAGAQAGYAWLIAHETPQSPAAQYATLVRGLYAALGLPLVLPDTTVAPALEISLGRRPPPAVLLRIDAGLKDRGREGESLLAMLDFIGTEGPSNIAPEATARFVRTLARFGLAERARALALESLLLFRPILVPVPPRPPPPPASAQ